MMTLRGLKREVKNLAGGRYHSVQEKITEFHDGEVGLTYSGYIHALDHTGECMSPEEVLCKLKKIIEEKGGR